MTLARHAEQLAMKPWTLNPYLVVHLAHSLNSKPVTQLCIRKSQVFSHGMFCVESVVLRAASQV